LVASAWLAFDVKRAVDPLGLGKDIVMPLPARIIDSASYTALIETLAGISIRLEVIRQVLDPVDEASSTEMVSQIRDEAIKAAAFARVDPAEGIRINDQMISVLTIKPN
jgi:hypothetical protein